MDAVGVVERADLRASADEAVLEHARADSRVVVTRNVSDFARLDRLWHAEGRLHHGVAMVTIQAFPQDRDLVGGLVRALQEALRLDAVPSPGQVAYLRAVPPR